MSTERSGIGGDNGCITPGTGHLTGDAGSSSIDGGSDQIAPGGGGGGSGLYPFVW